MSYYLLSHIICKNKKLKWRVCLIALSLLLFSFPSYGQSSDSSYLSYTQELTRLIQNGGRQVRRECADEVMGTVFPGNINESFAQARQLVASHRRRQGCQAVSYYLGIIEHGNEEQIRQARAEIVEAYVLGGDSFGAMNSANFFLGTYGQNQNIRFRMIEVAREYFATHPERDPFWEKMILGIHPTQQQGNSLYQNFIARNFLADFPQISPQMRAVVDEVYKLAIDNIDQHFLAIAKFYHDRREYKATIIRLQPVWRIGPNSNIFPESLYLSIDSFIKLAQQVQTVGEGRVIRQFGLRTIDADRVRDLLELEATDPVDYAEQVNFLLEQASLLMEIMEANIPGNPWTARAQALFAN